MSAEPADREDGALESEVVGDEDSAGVLEERFASSGSVEEVRS